MSAGHVAPKSMYYLVFAALVVGTIVTYLAALVDLGPLNNVVMLAIACTKAALVVLFFMHVRWSTRLTWVVAMSGFFWLLILFTLGMADYMSRGWIGSVRPQPDTLLPLRRQFAAGKPAGRRMCDPPLKDLRSSSYT
jgi:cytochrome c oxidase subunit IV